MRAHTIARHVVRMLRDNNFMLRYKRLLADRKFITNVPKNKEILAKAKGNLVAYVDECIRAYGVDMLDCIAYPLNVNALSDADYYKLYNIRVALLDFLRHLNNPFNLYRPI